jgi:hypothetical protein
MEPVFELARKDFICFNNSNGTVASITDLPRNARILTCYGEISFAEFTDMTGKTLK